MRDVEMNERLLQRLQEYDLMLLDAASLPAFLDVLLLTTRTHFGLSGASLTLYDPQAVIEKLMPPDLDYGDDLLLTVGSFDLQQLYGATPGIEVIDVTDRRAEQAVQSDVALETLVLLPLQRDGQLVGSFQWGSSEKSSL